MNLFDRCCQRLSPPPSMFRRASQKAPGTWHLAAAVIRAVLALVALGAIAPVASLAQVAVTVSPAVESVLPSSSWEVYSNVSGAADPSVNWNASCGTVAASPGYVTWTAPSSAGTCTVTATSNADPTQSASSTFTIVNATLRISNIPMQATVYKDQPIDIQSIVWGSTTTAVAWSSSGGSLTTSDREAVFSASAPGTYTVTSTSAANNAQSATTTIVVTADEWPNAATPNRTMPIDCIPVGSGNTYEVTSEATMDAVPWRALGPGDTVRIHPGTYHRQFVISTSGSPSEPIRVCGVPDSSGNLPEISGANAVATPGAQFGAGANSTQDMGGIQIYNYGGSYYGGANYPSNIVIEGLKIDGFNNTNSYTANDTGLQTSFGPFTSGIRIQRGSNITLRGNEIAWNNNGIFSLSNNSVESEVTRDLLVEGNYFHDNGRAGDGGEHQSYLQAFGEVVQGNYYGYTLLGATGVQIKTRTSQQFIRYNYFESTPYAILDFPYIDGDGGFVFPWLGLDSAELANTSPEDVVANYESYQDIYVYGNVFHNVDGPHSGPIYFFFDTDYYDLNPGRNLYIYYNTFYQSLTRTAAYPHWADSLLNFGPYSAPLNDHSVFPTGMLTNNAIYIDQSPASPTPFMWNANMADRVNLDRNWISTGWGTGIPGTGEPPSGYGSGISSYTVPPSYTWQYGQLQAWVLGVNNLLSDATLPFDPITYQPHAGSALIDATVKLPNEAASLPPLMQYNPASFLMSPRATLNDIGAVGFSTVALAPDSTPPTIPGGVTATAASPFTTALAWNTSVDVYVPTQIITGLAGYNVYRNGIQIATVTGTTYSDTGLSPNTTYSYTITALDAAGNESAQSVPANITTVAVNGVCGTANAQTLFTKPAANLCDEGTASAVSGPSNGAWTWSCTGSSGGSIASCSAFVTQPANTGSISGTVSTGSTGIAGVVVLIKDPVTSAVVASAVTGADGSYLAGMLMPGNYKVKFDGTSAGYIPAWYENSSYAKGMGAATLISVSAGVTTPGINATLAPGGSISGSVTNGSAGIAGIAVQVFDGSYALVGSTATDINGNYSIGGIPAGTVEVEFEGNNTGYISQWFQNKSYAASILGATPVPVSVGSTTSGINAVLTSGGSITGVVTNGFNPVSAYITVSDSSGAFVTSTTTAADGTYSATGIPAGNMLVQFLGAPSEYLSQWYSNQTTMSKANKVIVKAGSVTPGINAALTPASGFLNGVCGAANGTIFTSAPTAGLCTSGTASAVNGSGPWNWSCQGGNGGTTASCAALGQPVVAVALNWASPAPIPYGTALSAQQLDATASYNGSSVPGTFVYTPAAGSVLGAGAQTLSVVFMPADTSRYLSAAATVQLNILQGAPAINWPAPSAIQFGAALSSMQLDATATYNGAAVPGSFTYTPALGTAPGAGTQILSVSFTPADTVDFAAETATVQLTVNQAVPVVSSWPNASSINFGQTLASSTLTGGTASVSGTFRFAAPATAPQAGYSSVPVIFAPTDSIDYATVSGTVIVSVIRATATVTLGNMAQTYSGSALNPSAATTPAGLNVSWSGAPQTLAGSYAVTATVNDPNYVGSASGSFVINKATPTVNIWPAASAIVRGQTLASSTLGGGSASVSGSFSYASPATAPATGSYSAAVAFIPTDSSDYTTVTGAVLVTVNNPPAAVPVFSPAPGTYSGPQTVSIGSTTPGATILYTTDGTNPVSSKTAKVYSGAINVTKTTLFEAVVEAANYTNSQVIVTSYTISLPQAAAPTFNPPAGHYATTQYVTLNSTTPNALFGYTTDGTDPTTSQTRIISAGPIAVSSNMTIRAFADAPGASTNSPVSTATYQIGYPAASAPVFSLPAGNYSGAQTVTITTATPNAVIVYTTDGTNPTNSLTAITYSGPVTIPRSATLSAFANAPGVTMNSTITSAAYSISLPAAAAPSFIPAAGTYSGPVTVTLSSATPNALFAYTTDGSDPNTSSTRTISAGPISVSVNMTIKAFADAPGATTNSPVSSAAYVITQP